MKKELLKGPSLSIDKDGNLVTNYTECDPIYIDNKEQQIFVKDLKEIISKINKENKNETS